MYIESNSNEETNQSVQFSTVENEHAIKDGITHINIWSRGETDLGRGLSHFHHSPFIHPYFGPFNSMEGFWYYIKTAEQDDALRNLSGHHAKEYGRTLTGRWRANFREIINAANFYRIDQNDALEQLMYDSELPFDHYYLFGPGNILIRPKGYEWLVEGFEEIRTMVQQGKKPQELDYSQT